MKCEEFELVTIGSRVPQGGSILTEEQGLERKLGLAEALGLSLSIVGPSMAMAFNVSLVVRAAGTAAPLAFIIGTLAMGMVAISFVKFSRRIAHAGSAYAYIGKAFGWRWGMVAGWTLLLSYLTYAAGATALIGNFVDAAFRNYSTQVHGVWFVSGAAGLLLAGVCAYRDVRLASRLMLLLEALSVLAIIFLCLAILAEVAGSVGLSIEPFKPATNKHWSGIGYGMVYCVLSFAGFEGVATLGEEARNPHRNIPVAILGTCVVSGAFYVFVSYSQVVGIGIDSTRKLADASAPLNDLAIKYVSRTFATAIDLATALSAFSCVLGSLSAAARLLFALSRAGMREKMGNASSVPDALARAVIFTVLPCLASFVVYAPFIGPANYCSYLLTIGTLALILVYICMTAAELSYSFRTRTRFCMACGGLGQACCYGPFTTPSIHPRRAGRKANRSKFGLMGLTLNIPLPDIAVYLVVVTHG